MSEVKKKKSFFSFDTLRQYNISLIFLIVTLFAVSLYSISTASTAEIADSYFKGSADPVWGHIFKMVVGFIALVVCAVLPARNMRIPIAPAYILMCIVLVLLLPVFGKTVNGATRWIRLPFIPMDIQPSEFLKLGLVFLYAFFGSERLKESPDKDPQWFLHYGMPSILALFLILIIGIQNVSTGLILLIFIVLYLFVLRLPMKIWLGVSGGFMALVAVGFIGLYMIPKSSLSVDSRLYTVKCRIERKLSSTSSDEFEINDQNRQEKYNKIALANSRLFLGQGFGRSKMKDVLPMASSDYVYAVLIEELGLVALIGVPALYVWWFVIAGILAKREKNPFLQAVLYGIGLVFPLQALVNVVVVSGLFTTGQPLPFLSAGGSSLLASCIALGFMLSISKRQYERLHEQPKELSK
jgi:hypothetical protein